MYKNNIYIENHEEVAAMGGDIGVCLDKYDQSMASRAMSLPVHSTATGVRP